MKLQAEALSPFSYCLSHVRWVSRGQEILPVSDVSVMCRRTSQLKEPALLSERREPARARERAVFLFLLFFVK